MKKTCTSCHEEKSLDFFYAQRAGLHGKTSTCNVCRNKKSRAWQIENKDRVRDNNYQRKFGLTLEQYKAMSAAQGHVCAICKEKCNSGRVLAVDHNHKTGKNRSLLCGNCNRGIGNLRESPAILQRAMDYLNAHS